MAPPDAAVAHYESQVRQAEAVALLARRQWRRVSVEDLDGTWAAIANKVAITVASGMLGAARAGVAYVPAVLDDDGQVDGEVAAARFAQTASDGRPLDSLLYASVVRTKLALSSGLTAPQALGAGGAWLDTLARTQVADAGRGAVGVAIAARPRTGYVRLVSPPCCQRCAGLAGKKFRWNTGFLRHPRCDCRHVPCSDDAAPAGLTSDVHPDQVKDLTEDQRRAVADGADLNQVINAHRRGARSADGMTTSEGATRRGVYGGYRRNADGTLTRVQKGEKVPRRLTPEAIYRLSSSREEALELLRRYGYLL